MAMLGTGQPTRWRRLVVAGVLCLAGLASVGAQTASPTLQEVEAAYIVKFAGFVHWPDAAFLDDRAPLVVGVMDDIELSRALALAVRGRTVHGKPLRVVPMTSVDTPRGLHVLVLPRTDHPARRRLLQEVAGRPILTIAPPDEAAGADPLPAVIRLVLEDNRLRFDVEPPAQEQGLRLSALMLTAARRVGGVRR